MVKIAPDKALPQTKNRGQWLTLTTVAGLLLLPYLAKKGPALDRRHHWNSAKYRPRLVSPRGPRMGWLHRRDAARPA